MKMDGARKRGRPKSEATEKGWVKQGYVFQPELVERIRAHHQATGGATLSGTVAKLITAGLDTQEARADLGRGVIELDGPIGGRR
jgi:hypothetical protein